MLEPGSALPARPSPGVAGVRLGEIYSGNARMVYGLCRMLLDDPIEAEDATQQVFLSAYRSLLTGTEVDKPAAWLGTIARHECQARSTARARTVVAFNDAVTLVSPGADEQAAGRADAAELYSEVAALPDKQRAAVVLRDIYGLRYDEVASALGTSRPAVEALLFRGRRRLKHRLRPGLAAGVLVVPLSLHESLAYAVPGFATAAGPVGAAAGAMALPLLAKVAAVGAAATLAGTTGVIAERQIRDSPVRPRDAAKAQTASPKPAPVVRWTSPARSLVSAGTPMLGARADKSRTEDSHGDEPDDELRSSDHEGGDHDDVPKSEHASAEHDNELQKSDDQRAEPDSGGHDGTAEHASSTEPAHTDEAAASPDLVIEDTGAEPDVPHDGEHLDAPDSGGHVGSASGD